MPFVPVPGVVSYELRGTLLGQEVENVIYVQQPTGQPQIASIAAAIEAWIDGTWSNLWSVSAQWDEIYATVLTTDTSPAYSFPISPAITGGDGSPSLPGNVAFCFSARTDARGRSARGRLYAFGIPEDKVTGNLLDPTVVSGGVAALMALRSTIGSMEASMVVVSRISGGVPRETGLVRPITVWAAVDNVVDSQRRRLTGRGI